MNRAERRHRPGYGGGYPAHMLAAVAYHRSDDMIDAAGLYQKILQRFLDPPDALHFLGVIAGEMGELEKAVKLIDLSLQLDPGNAVYSNNYGNVLRQAGAPMHAIASSRSIPLLLRTRKYSSIRQR